MHPLPLPPFRHLIPLPPIHAHPRTHLPTRTHRTHTKEKPFVCPFPNCDKSFSRIDGVQTHYVTHTMNRTYVCEHPGCGKSYFHTRSLVKHQRSHAAPPAGAAGAGAAAGPSYARAGFPAPVPMYPLQGGHPAVAHGSIQSPHAPAGVGWGWAMQQQSMPAGTPAPAHYPPPPSGPLPPQQPHPHQQHQQ